MGVLTKSVYLAASAILISYLYQKLQTRNESILLDEIEKQVTEVWDKQIKFPQKRFTRLAVGINANVDLIVSGVELLDKLKQIAGNQVNHQSLKSVSDLQETFAYFFSRGRAAERLFKDPEVYKDVIKAVLSLNNVKQYVGGNAALMAMNAASLFPDVHIHFVGPVGPILKEMMSTNISIPTESIVEDDEFHLIMEYKVGENWGEATAPVATRFICSYDASNQEMSMLETYFASLPEFQPDLILLSGLHMMDTLDQDLFQSRLSVLVAHLAQVNRKIPIHLELASMANGPFVRDILEKVLPKITSLGLNEQELAFASLAMGGPHVEHLEQSEGQPIIAVMADLIQWLLQTFGKSAQNPNSRLTRIHFHSLTYHIVGVHRKSWRNVRSATMAGTRVAGMQACGGKVDDPDLVDLRIPLEFTLHAEDGQHTFEPGKAAYTWTVGEFYFVFSPVLVCKEPVKTVGLGDAISATGLMYSQFIL